MRKTIILACILVNFSPFIVQAQTDSAYIPFYKIAEHWQKQSDYHFYYLKAETDTLYLNKNAVTDNIPQSLENLFKDSKWHYSISKNKAVFITYGWEIKTSLPENFIPAAPDSTNQFPTEKPKENKIIVDFYAHDDTDISENETRIIGTRTNFIAKGKSRISGRITEDRTGEPIIGANVLLQNSSIGVSTDPLGYYTILVPNGRQKLLVSSMGMRNLEQSIMVYSDGSLNLEMLNAVESLQEVVVSAERNININRAEMGINNLNIKEIAKMPGAMGEVDVIKAVISLPGVKTVGEASTGFNVRGGSTDQNLILYNNAPIFNPAHLFGFFSSFNPDVLSGVELYKGSIPAQYGGRLSSVLAINSKEGNKKKFSGAGGIGLVTGRLLLEGPIIKNKTSFIIGGRSNYSNWILKKLDNPTYRSSKAQFYDLDFGISHQINEKNNLYLNAYYSNDFFRFKADTNYSYTNKLMSLRWKHLYSDKLYSTISGTFSAYDFSINSTNNPATAFDLSYNMNLTKADADFTYLLHTRHTLNFGASTQFYKINPGSFLPNDPASLVLPDIIQSEQALESGIYISDRYSISPELVLTAGLRYSVYNYLGSRSVTNYDPQFPRSEFSVTDTTIYGNFENIKTYHLPEIRLALRYSLGNNSSVKMSYNTLRQHIHMLSNTAAISPTDIWKLSDSHILPQYGQQLSLGYFHNFMDGIIETSVELYVKKMEHYLDYRSGAQLIMNHHIERDVINTEGKAYGLEILFKKTSGKLNGWLSYTYSRTLIRQDDPIIPEQINDGEWYPTNFDKPHDVSMVTNYKFTHRYSFSTNFTYSTGRPITLPIGKYYYNGSQRVLYSDRNQYRIPDYYRLDIGFNIEGSHKVKKLAHSSWTFSVYNLLGRKNPYSVYFESRGGEIQGYKLSIFGQPIPTITYNFKF